MVSTKAQNVGSGRRVVVVVVVVVVVGIPLSELLLIGVPGKRLAITFSVIDIFACGFFAAC